MTLGCSMTEARTRVSVSRSARADVRNPVLGLQSAQALQELGNDARQALRAVLLDISADARKRAELSWRTRKPPMAAYWACIAVWAKHIARAINKAT